MDAELVRKISYGLEVFYSHDESSAQIQDLREALAYVIAVLMEKGLMTKEDCRDMLPSYVNLEE